MYLRSPRRALVALTAGVLLAGAAVTFALPRLEKAEVDLVADRTSYEAGGTGRLGAVMVIEDGWHTNSHQPTYDYLIPTEVTIGLPEGWSAHDPQYPKGELETFTFAEEPLSVYQHEVTIVVGFDIPTGVADGTYEATLELIYQACDDATCLPPVTVSRSLELRVGAGGTPTNVSRFTPAAETTTAGRGPSPMAGASIGLMIGLGLLGGIILNAMPCVLPVLSIKVFSIVKSASRSRRDVVVGGLATTAGIVMSFWALAVAAIVARSAGEAVGWGVQFQNPVFVAVLVVIVMLFSLNMWGLFEIQLPSRLATIAGSGPNEGIGGHFVTGLFATLMATPCSAPFLGTAVGFALAQPASVILAVFTAVGVGMSLPYLLLAAWPGAVSFFPKPGPWMVRLRQVMGFLLAAAAIWLFYVLAAQLSSERLAFIELSVLGLAFAVWLMSSSASTRGRRLAAIAALAAVGSTVWIAAAAPPPSSSTLPQEAAGLIDWVMFDRQEAERLAAAGTPVPRHRACRRCLRRQRRRRHEGGLDQPQR